MLIQYYLADGQKIRYHTEHDNVCLQDIEELAMLYAQARPKDLPTDVYISIKVSAGLMHAMSSIRTYNSSDGHDGPQMVSIWTSAGPLKINVMPWAFDKFMLLVGKQEDYNRYDIDKIFEDVVLAGCERE